MKHHISALCAIALSATTGNLNATAYIGIATPPQTPTSTNTVERHDQERKAAREEAKRQSAEQQPIGASRTPNFPASSDDS